MCNFCGSMSAMISMNFVPKYAFFVSGTGCHKDKLQAFEQALLDAGPIAHNLVAVSSILPAGCEVISPEKGFSMLTPGEITFCVMARQDTNQKDEFASAAVGVVKTDDKNKIGYLSEYHGDTEGEEETEKIAKRLAIEMFETKFNVSSKDLNLELFQASVASIQQPGDDRWVSAVAICFLVL